MLSFHQFTESKENSYNQKEMVDFFTKRKDGARKILNESKAKNTSASKLTVWHFEAKVNLYLEIIIAIKSNRPKSHFESKYRITLEKLRKAGTKQKQFQEEVGRLEVWGECLIKLFDKE